MPQWSRANWTKIEAALPKDQDWDVWTRWYRDVLNGIAHDKAYDLTFAGWDGERFIDIWKDGPAAANKWIKEHLPNNEANDSLSQTAAPFVFHVVDGQIAASPMEAAPKNRTLADDLYDETREKLRDLVERMKRAQVDESLRANAARLETRLGEKLAHVNIGLLLSSLRSLEGDYRNFSTEEGRKECPADLLSKLDSTVETLRDLVATFPDAREIAAERLALDIGDNAERLEAIEKKTDGLVAVAERSPAVREDAVEALREPDKAIANARTAGDKSYQLSLRLLDIANFARAVLQGAGRVVVKSAEEIEKQVPSAVGRAAARAIAIGGTVVIGYALGPSGRELARDVAGIVKTLGDTLKPGNPLQRIGKKYDEVEKSRPADAESAKPGEESQTGTPHVTPKKKAVRKNPKKQ